MASSRILHTFFLVFGENRGFPRTLASVRVRLKVAEKLRICAGLNGAAEWD